MKITDSGKIGNSSGVRKKGAAKSSDSASFASLINGGDETEKTSGTGDISGVSMLDSLFAVQQIENAYQRTEESIKQGKLMLDVLDELRMGMLTGGISKEKIQLLKNSVNKERGWVIDQKLTDILDEIETRAEVELAKIEMAGNESNKTQIA